MEKENPKADYGVVQLRYLGNIFQVGEAAFERTVGSDLPPTFEQLGQDTGYVVYEHKLGYSVSDPGRYQ